MRNAGLEEAQAGIKTARRNINNLRYADDTTLMAESKKEHVLYESVLMRWKNLQPIIQSEVSQKETSKYHILMHIYRI